MTDTGVEEEEGPRGRGRRRLPPLAEVADVEAMTGNPVDPATRGRVERLLEMASAAVRGWCHQTISHVRNHTVTIPSTGTTLLLLAELPVTDVKHVRVAFGLDWWWQDEDEEFQPVEFVGEERFDFWGRFSWDSAGRLRRLDGMTWGLPNDPVTVTYSHGWRQVPPDVVAVVAAKVGATLAASAANPEGLRAVAIGDYSRTFADPAVAVGALTDSDKIILNAYRAQATAAVMGTQ